MSSAKAARWRAVLMLACAVPLCGWVVFEAQRVFRAEWASMAARQQVTRWVSTDAVVAQEDALQALAALQQALAITPKDPQLHERLGDLYTVLGRKDWDQVQLRNAHFTRAVAAYEASLALRPGTASAWAGLAVARQSLAGAAAGVHSAWQQAQARGPFEEHVQPVLLQVVLADWNGATPAMQSWAKALFDRSDANTRAQINALAKLYGLVFEPDASTPPR